MTARNRPDDVMEKTFIAAEVDARAGSIDTLVDSEAPAGGFAALGEDDWAR
ncbi:hypothetical protein AB0I93_15670 [Streptomyces sp. NPDC049967]|uniref:hypothetical protein n=1 Tax=unclassified Streptomyces TaxID=2593676 RepID=UPI002E290C1D|nr:hypothetical protein [Streptomyces sp. NBC_00342]